MIVDAAERVRVLSVMERPTKIGFVDDDAYLFLEFPHSGYPSGLARFDLATDGEPVRLGRAIRIVSAKEENPTLRADRDHACRVSMYWLHTRI